MPADPANPPHTCADYRLEMVLLSLQRQLEDPNTPQEQRGFLKEELQRLRRQLEME